MSIIPGLTVTVATVRTSYTLGTGIVLGLKLMNTTDSAITLETPAAKTHDFVIKRDGQKVWQWSEGRTFAASVTDLVIPAHQGVSFYETWTQLDATGQPAGVGTYTLEGAALGHQKGGTAVPATPAPLTFSIVQP